MFAEFLKLNDFNWSIYEDPRRPKNRNQREFFFNFTIKMFFMKNLQVKSSVFSSATSKIQIQTIIINKFPQNNVFIQMESPGQKGNQREKSYSRKNSSDVCQMFNNSTIEMKLFFMLWKLEIFKIMLKQKNI